MISHVILMGKNYPLPPINASMVKQRQQQISAGDGHIRNCRVLQPPLEQLQVLDQDGDGRISGSDVQSVFSKIAGGNTRPEFDLNGDGEVNLTDVQWMDNLLDLLDARYQSLQSGELNPDIVFEATVENRGDVDAVFTVEFRADVPGCGQVSYGTDTVQQSPGTWGSATVRRSPANPVSDPNGCLSRSGEFGAVFEVVDASPA